MINKRKAMVLEMMKELAENGLIESILEMELEKSKEQFFKKLTPKDEQAYRVIFIGILEKYTSVRKLYNGGIIENWANDFIEYHNEKVSSMKENLQETMYSVIKEYGDDYVKKFFTQEKRSLDELIEATGNYFLQAIEAKEEEEKDLHEKLHKQLSEVVETLKAITSDKKGEKEFTIELDEAQFNVKLDDSEPCPCCSDSDEELMFKELLSKLGVI